MFDILSEEKHIVKKVDLNLRVNDKLTLICWGPNPYIKTYMRFHDKEDFTWRLDEHFDKLTDLNYSHYYISFTKCYSDNVNSIVKDKYNEAVDIYSKEITDCYYDIVKKFNNLLVKNRETPRLSFYSFCIQNPEIIEELRLVYVKFEEYRSKMRENIDMINTALCEYYNRRKRQKINISRDGFMKIRINDFKENIRRYHLEDIDEFNRYDIIVKEFDIMRNLPYSIINLE